MAQSAFYYYRATENPGLFASHYNALSLSAMADINSAKYIVSFEATNLTQDYALNELVPVYFRCYIGQGMSFNQTWGNEYPGFIAASSPAEIFELNNSQNRVTFVVGPNNVVFKLITKDGYRWGRLITKVNTPTPGNPGPDGPIPPVVVEPPLVGSGQVYFPLGPDDKLPTIKEITTEGMWSDNLPRLLDYIPEFNSPIDNDYYNVDKADYIIDIYNSFPGDDDCAEKQFSIIYADFKGSGSIDYGGLDGETMTKAMYSQYANILLPSDQPKFIINGVSQEYVYIIDVGRERYKTSMDTGNWELAITDLNVSAPVSGNSTPTSVTDFNELGAVLIDETVKSDLPINISNKVYSIRKGNLEDGFDLPITDEDSKEYGLFYPNHGVIILAGSILDSDFTFATNRNTSKHGCNPYRLFKALKFVTDYEMTDGSGDLLGFKARFLKISYNNYYYVRVKNQLFNFSNNPTYVTGKEGLIIEPFLYKNKAYITSVGLYNSSYELLAVGKVSQPILSSMTDESLFTVKISH